MSIRVNPDGSILADSMDEAVSLSRRMRRGANGCVITVEVEQGEDRLWHAFADSSVGVTMAEAKSHGRALERALAAMVRRVYQKMDDGKIALNDVFPMTYRVVHANGEIDGANSP